MTARDTGRAADAIAGLRRHEPSHDQLPMLDRLVSRIGEWEKPSSHGADIARSAVWLDEEMQNASRVLGPGAQEFMASFFRELALIAGDADYDPARPKAHRAWLCLRSGEWAQAEEAALSIPNAGQCPDALHWLGIARHRSGGLDAARSVLFELAMREPSRFAPVLAELGDEVLDQEWDAFQDACEWEHTEALAEWFPAWYLVEYPAAAKELEDLIFPDTSPGNAARQVLRLIDLERQGICNRLIS